MVQTESQKVSSVEERLDHLMNAPPRTHICQIPELTPEEEVEMLLKDPGRGCRSVDGIPEATPEQRAAMMGLLKQAGIDTDAK